MDLLLVLLINIYIYIERERERGREREREGEREILQEKKINIICYSFSFSRHECCPQQGRLYIEFRVVTGLGKKKQLLGINFNIFLSLKKLCDHPKFFLGPT